MASGELLSPVDVAYETYGTLNPEGTNAILICHAMTGDSHAASCGATHNHCATGWWHELIGPGKVIDTRRYHVICSNILGSCYGTSGPASSQRRSGPHFPDITVRDMVRVQRALLDQLGVRHLVSVIGGSLGGMQVLEWALMYPDMMSSIIPIATSARHSAWAIGLNEVARLAITTDPNFQGGFYQQQPERGLSVARMVAMLSYRHMDSYNERFGREGNASKTSDDPFERPVDFAVESYLRYQGKKLVNRFDANSYITISRAMDAHDVSRGRYNNCLKSTLKTIKAKTMCIGIDSDLLYPAAEQQEIAASIPGSTYREIKSPHGHDAFLLEFEQLNRFLEPFLSDVQGRLNHSPFANEPQRSRINRPHLPYLGM